MKTSRVIILLLILAALTLTLGSVDAFAQKKKPAATTVEQQRPPAAPSAKSGMMLRDVLVQHKGAVTTLGRLKSVEADFIVIDDDGTEIMYPIAMIHSIKVLKLDEETPDESAPRIDIKLQ